MPTYTFEDTRDGTQETLFMKIAERDEFLAANPHLKQVIVSPLAIGDPVKLGLRHASNNFQNRLKEIKRSHYKSTINTGNITEI